MKKFTKIVCTIGPASFDIEILKKMFDAGMNVARLNFSHGTYPFFEETIKNIRKISNEIAIILDTKGPEIRSGELKDGFIELKPEDKITLTNRKILGDKNIIQIEYNYLNELKSGNLILIDDGFIELEVEGSNEKGIVCSVLNGGRLENRKTVSIRGHYLKVDFLSKKDKEDILFGIKMEVDFIAASFVRTVDDVLELRDFLNQNGGCNINIISKIEHESAVKNLDEILKFSQAVMVARGDLGVDIALEKVPKVQKEIIIKANNLAIPVIVATQMLESMKSNSKPTRAEVSDVAIAILEGADAIMLSEETAIGKFPIKAISIMTKIAKEYDLHVKNNILDDTKLNSKEDISCFITKTAYEASQNLDVKIILVPTESGFSPRNVSKFRPKIPIIAITRNRKVYNQLILVWGVHPIFLKDFPKSYDALRLKIVSKCIEMKYLTIEDKFVLTTGYILARKGHTNILEVFKAKTILE